MPVAMQQQPQRGFALRLDMQQVVANPALGGLGVMDAAGFDRGFEPLRIAEAADGQGGGCEM
ncbi:hypothetical protein D3C72_1775640 [compost metagenome]